MDAELPYWENKNKKNLTYIKLYVGKSCYICLYKSLYLPFYSIEHTTSIKGIIKNYDETFLDVSVPVRKKTYSLILDINNISAIAAEDENNN